jgi:L-lactate dehydrogenase complex protein LldE
MPSARPKQITLFVQCLVDAMYPEVAEAMVAVFRRLGIGIDCPRDQTCCGQPAFNSGYRQAATVAAKKFIDVFEDAEVIVCPSGSCIDMVRYQYPRLLADDPRWDQRARRLAAKVFEFSQYLVDGLGIDRVGAYFDGTLTYHESCHLLRHLNISRQPRQLIAAVDGAELVEMEAADRCCGFGGTFAFKYPHISTALVAEKVDHILATGADAVVGCDISCLMNIQGYLHRRQADVRVLHIAQLLAGKT